jgi:predicted HTH transcriptional regulator
MSKPRFYNTTSLEGKDLVEAIANAESQEHIILELFKRTGRLSPSEVCRLLDYKYPITSVRRAISNLTRDGYLEKTDKKKKGFYGRLEYVWEIKIKRNGEVSDSN